MPRGRPRKDIADDETQAKRNYQRDYQQARKDKITQLTTDIKKCEEDLKKMKKERADLKQLARDKLDRLLVGVPYDPDQPNALKKAIAYKRQQAKGNKIKT
jgi:hypothetical protein